MSAQNSPGLPRSVALDAEDDFEGWRAAARALALSDVPPDAVIWQIGEAPADLFGQTAVPVEAVDAAFSVPRPFVDLAQTAILHSDAERFSLLYALLLRVREKPGLFEDRADPLIRRLEDMARAVRRDIHKMRAFLRFREVDHRFVAWFEPEHHIVRANAGFFVRRFATMQWSILTPQLSVHWDGDVLREGPGAHQSDAPQGDPVEEVWKAYYGAIFNPARLKIGAMLKEMPKKYWKNMPETALVSGLIAGAQAREAGMIEKAPRTSPGSDSQAAWLALREEALACTRCHLHRNATQTVFGEGPMDARIMFVGEQPGDQEDLQGRPFVGPAGQVFDQALGEAGIDRARTHVTNAVKHFKFEPRGKKRIHQTPDVGEIQACKWWVDQERMIVRPDLTIALGATAARSVFGKAMVIGKSRGRLLDIPGGGRGWITVHPSYILRIPNEREAALERARFVDDLRGALAALS